MWIIGLLTGIALGAASATARYRGVMWGYFGAMGLALAVVWLLSSRGPGIDGLVFIGGYIVVYLLTLFVVLPRSGLERRSMGGPRS